jgi:hypothetical protein
VSLGEDAKLRGLLFAELLLVSDPAFLQLELALGIVT